MAEVLDELPVMGEEERKNFVEKLIEKLSFVRGLQDSGLNINAAEEAVRGQIRDTIQTGDPKKA